MANIQRRRTRLRAARRRRRDRHELRALRLRPGRRARMDHRRCRRDLSRRRTLPGVDLVLPDIRFIEEKLANLRGIVITHAHEDHYGALLDLWPRLKAPVLDDAVRRRPARGQAPGRSRARRRSRSRSTAPARRSRSGRSRSRRSRSPTRSPSRCRWPSPRRSAPSSTPATGRSIRRPTIGPLTDEARFRALGDEGVLALICDSTNALREGEFAVRAGGRRRACAKLIEKAPRAASPSPPSPPMSAASARSPRPRATPAARCWCSAAR